MFLRNLTLTLGSVALVSLSLASTSDAQTKMRFAQMDRNNDGVITRDEWKGSARSFEVHDWNNDGRLSGNEVLAGARRDTDWEQADHRANAAERNLNWTRRAFTNLDHNRDGRLTPNEWHFDRESFRRADRNRDDVLSQAEFLGEDWNDDRGDDFDDIDYNNDGWVSRSEWHGGANEFNWLDQNHDGWLSRYEVVGSNPNFSTVYNEFQNLDWNRDSRLERNEWHWSAASFRRIDTNNDGVITTQEFERSGGAPGTIGALGGRVAEQTFRIDPRQRWHDTGITVQAGDRITFRSSGRIQLSDNSSDVAVPAGALSHRMANDAPISGIYAGALIAKIGGYNAVAIGDQQSITAPVSGRLYLGVNDDHLPDNSGEFTVSVGVDRR